MARQDKLDTNESLQSDEIQALSAIFEKEWVLEDSENKVYSITVSNSSGESVYLQVKFSPGYPLESPPTYLISAPWLSRNAKNFLEAELNEIYSQNLGVSIIHLWIEKIQDFIEGTVKQLQSKEGNSPPSSFDGTLEVFEYHNKSNEPEKLSHQCESEVPLIEHGEPIIDRKSIFQAHVAKIDSVKQVKLVLQKLKENRKISEATHNVMAFRITQGKNMNEDFEDDGESKAGSVLLHLLQVTDARDVLIVVSRWYGGSHLGSDRFKHYSNAAKVLLLKLGMIKKGHS